MGYFHTNYFQKDDKDSLEHRAKYGTVNSTSSEKGTDDKKNNTSEYNHNYYLKNKDKWEDNDSSDGKKTAEDKDNFDVDSAAMDVIRGKYGNGEERKRKLGDDYEVIQRRVNELMKKGVGKSANKSSVENEKSDNETPSNDSKDERSWDAVKKDYYSDKDDKKKKSISHSDFENFGNVLVRDIPEWR